MSGVGKKEDPEQIKTPPEYSLLSMNQKCTKKAIIIHLPVYIEANLRKLIQESQDQSDKQESNRYTKVRQRPRPIHIGNYRSEIQPDKTLKKCLTFNPSIITTFPSQLLPSFYFKPSPPLTGYHFFVQYDLQVGKVSYFTSVTHSLDVFPDDRGKVQEILNYLISSKEKKTIMLPDSETSSLIVHHKATPTRHSRNDNRDLLSQDQMISEIMKLFREKDVLKITEVSRRLDQPEKHVQKALETIARYDGNRGGYVKL